MHAFTRKTGLQALDTKSNKTFPMNLYDIFLQHPVVTTDSRNCPAGSIFFALKGESFNANEFAAKALENGCSYAVIDEKQFAVDERYILVEDVLKAMQNLANTHRKALKTKIIGITGTNGKTTTKELIAAVLQEKFNLHFTRGNLNNHIGVPLTLLQLNASHDLAVVEMGANHPGEIEFLCNICEPDFGIITNVGKAHLEGFGSFEGVMKTKAELYDFIVKNGKGIFINQDNNFLNSMADKSGVQEDLKIPYSLTKKDDPSVTFGRVFASSPLLEVICHENIDEPVLIQTQLIGSYNAENVLAAVTIGQFFGLSNDQIKSGLEKYQPQNNRSQLTITSKNKLVVDAYNANPTSMKAAIQNFAEMQVNGKVLILGDMLELGEQTETEHLQVIELLKQGKFEQVFLVGKVFNALHHPFISFENKDILTEEIKNHPLEDKFILIKGSRGIQLEKVIPFL